jgi:quercetin dioxygenase-like cupin family protein
MHMLSGTITVQVADQAITLKVGDAVAFPGDVEHSYSNTHVKPARFSLTVFEPGVGLAAPSEIRHA